MHSYGVASTLMRRYIRTMCPLGMLIYQADSQIILSGFAADLFLHLLVKASLRNVSCFQSACLSVCQYLRHPWRLDQCLIHCIT